MSQENVKDNPKPVLQQQTTEAEGDSKLIYILFYAIGTLSFLPQNFYIIANDYWMYKFRDPNASTMNTTTTDSDKTELQKNFTSYFTIVTSASIIVAFVLTTILAQRISIHKRLLGSMCGLLLLFVITIILVWVDTDSWQLAFFGISLVIGILLQGFGGCFLLTSLQLATKFHPVYLAAHLSGQAVCGILAALIQILTLAIGGSSRTTAFIYFLIGTTFVLLVMVLYLYTTIKRKDFKNQLTNKKDDEAENVKIDRNALKTVGKKMVLILISLVLVYGMTTLINPGMTSLIESSGKGNGRWNDIFFVPVCTYLIYNVFDLIGREFALKFLKNVHMSITLTLSVLRVALVPLLMFCNIQPRNHLSVVFGEDYYYIIFMVIFSFSAGCLVNLCLLEITRACNPDEKKLAMFFIAAFMMVSMMGFAFINGVLINLL